MTDTATKIIATLGPATADEKSIYSLIKAGVNIFRLNFSHGDFDFHGKLIGMIRRSASRLNRNVGIMQDLPGPKIRLGEIPNIILKRGDDIALTADSHKPGDIPIRYSRLHLDINPGEHIYINDGLIRLRVLKISGARVKCRVEIGGAISSHKGVNLPGINISAPSFTSYDKRCLRFGVEHGVDFIAMSFVRSGDDVRVLRRHIKSLDGNQFIVAKIEKREALVDFDSILANADAVMIARGDLGIELPIAEVPAVQKKIIARCNQAGIPIITATQVLESMINSPRPTRAEATDAANAVLDGADAIMLSGETAIGNFPSQAVRILKSICTATEKNDNLCSPDRLPAGRKNEVAGCVAKSVCLCASALDIKLIAAPTRTGHTARLISRFRPKAKILAFSENACTRAQLLLSWGVESLPIDQKLPFDKLVKRIKKSIVEHRYAMRGETIIITAGSPHSRAGDTNLMVIETL